MSFKVKDALGGFGWLVAAIMGISGLLAGEQIRPVDEVVNIASSPAGFQCPAGWTQTRGIDPDARDENDEPIPFTACESERYIIKALDGGEPQGFDKQRGVYLDAEGLR